jgi:hypothetical protein
MPVQKTASVTKADIAALKLWRNSHGESVKHVTVRNFSTREKAGTLPYFVYELQREAPSPYDFRHLV